MHTVQRLGGSASVGWRAVDERHSFTWRIMKTSVGLYTAFSDLISGYTCNSGGSVTDASINLYSGMAYSGASEI